MRKPSYKTTQRVYIGPTAGKAVSKNSRRACLCADSNTYSIDCCKGYLVNQGIGATSRGPLERGAFSAAFSQDFDIKDIRDY
jgi:hypothetical protein